MQSRKIKIWAVDIFSSLIHFCDTFVIIHHICIVEINMSLNYVKALMLKNKNLKYQIEKAIRHPTSPTLQTTPQKRTKKRAGINVVDDVSTCRFDTIVIRNHPLGKAPLLTSPLATITKLADPRTIETPLNGSIGFIHPAVILSILYLTTSSEQSTLSILLTLLLC